jgi:hypothetical protein
MIAATRPSARGLRDPAGVLGRWPLAAQEDTHHGAGRAHVGLRQRARTA